jgi:superfamily II DNA/RNA helicase
VSLLVATDTAEEGIDVADCEFVIRFDRFGTTKELFLKEYLCRQIAI